MRTEGTRLGCVSFFNSKPLIEPLVDRDGVAVRFAVPSGLLKLMEAGEVDAALMPVVDFQACKRDVVLVPAGMIGCDGPTLTVRIFSKVPPEQITVLHGDTDSHTSVVLARLILAERYGREVPLEPLACDNQSRDREGATGTALPHGRSLTVAALNGPETMLLIGDKVVNAAPDGGEYPYQMDLGEEWKKLTGLPFVFAMWMMRRDVARGKELAKLLADAQRQGARMTETLLDRYCVEKRWPRELARQYFTKYLQYEVTDRVRMGLAKFYELAEKRNLLKIQRTVEYFDL